MGIAQLVGICSTPAYTEPPLSGIMAAIQGLAEDFDGSTATNSDMTTNGIQGDIESKHSSFNVFAIIKSGGVAEQMSGVSDSAGSPDFTAAGKFSYNSSSSDILSTGNDISVMTGASSVSGDISDFDDLPWMAIAYWDGSSGGFKGILVWGFTGDMINNSGTVTTNGHPVTNVKDIFYPDNSGNNFNKVVYAVFEAGGTLVKYDVDGTGGVGYPGWNYSNGQNPSSSGYNGTGAFSSDDGIWMFRVAGQNSSTHYNADGNSPGPDPRSGSDNYGAGNYNGGDSVSLKWAGTDEGNNWVGYCFSGDAN
mgnify:CR=1 FL=1